jgi:hypothetical protein
MLHFFANFINFSLKQKRQQQKWILTMKKRCCQPPSKFRRINMDATEREQRKPEEKSKGITKGVSHPLDENKKNITHNEKKIGKTSLQHNMHI